MGVVGASAGAGFAGRARVSATRPNRGMNRDAVLRRLPRTLI